MFKKHTKVKFNNKATTTMKTLNYTSKEINKNFRIKVAGIDNNGNRINKLVGVAGIIALIGVGLLNHLLNRAFRCLGDACYCKLRRGLKVTFYAK